MFRTLKLVSAFAIASALLQPVSASAAAESFRDRQMIEGYRALLDNCETGYRNLRGKLNTSEEEFQMKLVGLPDSAKSAPLYKSMLAMHDKVLGRINQLEEYHQKVKSWGESRLAQPTQDDAKLYSDQTEHMQRCLNVLERALRQIKEMEDRLGRK